MKMNLKRILVCAGLLTSFEVFSSGAQIVDLLVSKSAALFKNTPVKTSEGARKLDDIFALISGTGDGQATSIDSDKLISFVKGLSPDTARGKRDQEYLLDFFQKQRDQISSQEVPDAINKLTRLSVESGLGKGALLVCGGKCSGGSNALKYQIKRVTQSSVKEALNLVETDPKRYIAQINNWMSDLELGRFKIRGIKTEEAKSFAAMLALMNNPSLQSEGHKRIFKALRSYNKSSDGSIDLFSKDNPNNLHRLIINDEAGDDVLQGVAEALEVAAKKSPNKRRDAFFNYMEKQYGAGAKRLKEKNCYL